MEQVLELGVTVGFLVNGLQLKNIKIAAVVISLFLNGFAQLKKWNDKKANK